MIRVVCSGCGSALNAKDELAGQTRKCPKCGNAVIIPMPEPAAEPVSQAVVPAVEEEHPKRLNRQHWYLICDPARVIAMWSNNGQGWQIRGDGGMVSAIRNRDRLPSQGDFRLIELKLETIAEGHRLAGIASYQLARHYAIGNLAKGDDAILTTVIGPGPLSKDQKNAIRQVLREKFMPEVWDNSPAIVAYLSSADQALPS